jgi:EAL and modified HD-GYP domain-containing signal transduction protein
MVIDRSGEALDKESVVIEILEDAVPGLNCCRPSEMNAHGYRLRLMISPLRQNGMFFYPIFQS